MYSVYFGYDIVIHAYLVSFALLYHLTVSSAGLKSSYASPTYAFTTLSCMSL